MGAATDMAGWGRLVMLPNQLLRPWLAPVATRLPECQLPAMFNLHCALITVPVECLMQWSPPPPPTPAEICPAGSSAAPADPPYPDELSPCRFGDPQPLLDAAAAAGLGSIACCPLLLDYQLAAGEWWTSLSQMPDAPIVVRLVPGRAAGGGLPGHGLLCCATISQLCTLYVR